MNLRRLAIILASTVLASSFTGCAHQLEIKNISRYRNTSFISLEKQARVGIVSDAREIEGKRFVKEVANSLQKYNVRSTTSMLNKENLDYIATITIDSDYQGSGWNFLINWPGFLIFTPAWHGYNYTIEHDLSVLLTDAKTGTQIDSFNIPIELDIRHAAINRTWTEIGWLEWGITPFVGGIFFIQYDEKVTPIAHDKAIPVLADFTAQEIVERLQVNE